MLYLNIAAAALLGMILGLPLNATGQSSAKTDIHNNFRIVLLETAREIPEPLPPNMEPGFEWRGIKGWMWKPEQYLSEIPIMKKFKMNFLMNCYGSMFDIEHYGWADPNLNRWWEDLPDAKKKSFEKIVEECRRNGIEFCFSMNPNLFSKRIVDYDSKEDVDTLFKHYQWMQGLGVKWFNISLDDITEGIHASGQAKAVNEIYRRLKAKDPDAKMIFCPTFYWGDGTGKDQKPYLEILARELDPEIYLFWTGDEVVGKITRKAAETFRSISRHKLFIWDNYPVNDGRPAMHLGPVIDRDADLCEAADGYMSNPMFNQIEMNRIPMLTCADYVYNPHSYDPMRSISQAIVNLYEKKEERELIKEIVEAYPGMLIWGKYDTGLNCAREKFQQIKSLPHSHQACRIYVDYLTNLAERLDLLFPHSFDAEKKTIRDDVKYLRESLSDNKE